MNFSFFQLLVEFSSTSNFSHEVTRMNTKLGKFVLMELKLLSIDFIINV
jgi:hypothetical protein